MIFGLPDPTTDNHIYILVAGLGGLAIKVIEGLIEKWVERRRTKKTSKHSEATRISNDAERIRKELRAQNTDLRKELTQAKEEVDEWRERYWKEIEISNDHRTRNSTSQEQLSKLKERLREQGIDVDSGEIPLNPTD